MQKTLFRPLAILSAVLRRVARKTPPRRPPKVTRIDIPDYLRHDLGLPPRQTVQRGQSPPAIDPTRYM